MISTSLITETGRWAACAELVEVESKRPFEMSVRAESKGNLCYTKNRSDFDKLNHWTGSLSSLCWACRSRVEAPDRNVTSSNSDERRNVSRSVLDTLHSPPGRIRSDGRYATRTDKCRSLSGVEAPDRNLKDKSITLNLWKMIIDFFENIYWIITL